MDAEEERRLCEAVRDGDREAFRTLYLEYVSLVHGYLARRCGRDAADDLTAETFCRAWASRESFRWQGHRYRAWLVRIAHNLAVSRARRNREVVGIPLESMAATGRGPDAQAVVQSATEALRAAVARLPDLQRDVVGMRYGLGMSAIEVGAALGCSPEAVRAATHRALRQLRRDLTDFGPG